MIAGISSIDTVVTVFVNLHFKLFTCLYQAFGIIHRLLEMYIIVGCSVDQQQLSLQILCQTDRRSGGITFKIFLWRTPQENFEGYAATSPIRLAKDLQGKLLLIHGTADDNVHFQQTMDYAESLVQAGKQFEMQVYKDRNHSIYGGNTRYHLYTRMSNFLFDNL